MWIWLSSLFIPPESCGGVWELLTVLEGFKGEPEEDDGVEEAVQTMGPEDLQNRGQKDGGGRMEEKGKRGRESEAGDSKEGEPSGVTASENRRKH